MINKIHLPTNNGCNIVLSEFKPKTAPKASVFIASATGVKQSYYLKFSQFLATHGYHVYTFDYAGIGESKYIALTKFDVSASQWVENDSEAVVNYIKVQNPEIPLLAIGHSIGGQLLGLVPSVAKIDGMLMVASQTGYWKKWSGLQKYKMALLMKFIMPLLIKVKGYFPGAIIGSEDLPKSMALEWSKWCTSPNYLFDHVENGIEKFQRVYCPIFSVSVDDDIYAPFNTVDWLSDKYANAKMTRVHLECKQLNVKSMGHFGFFKSVNEEVIWSRLLGFLDLL